MIDIERKQESYLILSYQMFHLKYVGYKASISNIEYGQLLVLGTSVLSHVAFEIHIPQASISNREKEKLLV